MGNPVYILDQEEKIKLFQEMSVRPCAKVTYTKTQERVKIIQCGFCLFERCIPGITKMLIRSLEVSYKVKAELNF